MRINQVRFNSKSIVFHYWCFILPTLSISLKPWKHKAGVFYWARFELRAFSRTVTSIVKRLSQERKAMVAIGRITTL